MPQAPLVVSLSIGRRITGTVIGTVCSVFLLLTLIFGVNLLQVLSLITLPFSRTLFRAINRKVAGTWWGWCVSIARVFYGTRIIQTGDELPPGENVLGLLNHQRMTDMPFLFFLVQNNKSLGNLKGFAKDPIKYFPGVGWGLLFLDTVFVKRNWTKDEESIKKTFARINDDKIPCWLTLFCEGTRISDEKLAKSQQYAKEQGITPLRHLLLPRVNGFAASAQGLAGHMDAIYDVTIGYPHGIPTLWQYICGFARVAHVHVRRFPADQIPSSKEDLSQWIHKLYREKDELLDGFYKTGSF